MKLISREVGVEGKREREGRSVVGRGEEGRRGEMWRWEGTG